MSREHLILCGSAKLTSSEKVWEGAKRTDLQTGYRGNINLRISDITERMVANLPDVATDLVEIATYVYCADQATTRGGTRSFEYGEDWRRHFRFEIPVRRPDIWLEKRVVDELARTLSFLSDDDYEFAFTELKDAPAFEVYLEVDQSTRETSQVDEVLLFSGGLDSLGGAVEEILQQRRRVALVSHRSVGKISRRQRELVSDLARRVAEPKLAPFHVPVLINKEASLGREFTQRTRSFLYAAIGAVVARLFELDRIRFYENGVVGLNLPICAQVLGGRATRTAHPQVLNGFASLLSLLFERNFRVENPFLWKTRADVLARIKDARHADLCKHTVSCMHTWEITKLHTHCGKCCQCIDRRLAALAAGYTDDEDPREMYKVDVLTGPRAETEDRTMIERFVGVTNEIERMHDATQFCERFGEVSRLINHIEGRADEIAQGVFELCRRHARQVCGAIDAAARASVPDMRRRDLPDTCLVNLVYGRPDYRGAGGVEHPEQVANQFKRDGDGWSIFFGGVGGHYEALDGFAYIHQLLVSRRDTGADCKPFDAIDMVRGLKEPGILLPLSRSVTRPNVVAVEADARQRKPMRADTTLDPQTLQDIDRQIAETKQNVAEIREEIEKASSDAEVERLTRDELYPEQRKLQKLECYRRQALGLGGKLRPLRATDRDRARQTVRHAIRAAYKRLASREQPMTALVVHLKRSIPPASGGCFIYSPVACPDWQLD